MAIRGSRASDPLGGESRAKQGLAEGLRRYGHVQLMTEVPRMLKAVTEVPPRGLRQNSPAGSFDTRGRCGRAIDHCESPHSGAPNSGLQPRTTFEEKAIGLPFSPSATAGEARPVYPVNSSSNAYEKTASNAD